jgi:hypothetical protein
MNRKDTLYSSLKLFQRTVIWAVKNVPLIVFLYAGFQPWDILRNIKHLQTNPSYSLLILSPKALVSHEETAKRKALVDTTEEALARVNIWTVEERSNDLQILLVTMKDMLHERLSTNPITNRFIPNYEPCVSTSVEEIPESLSLYIQEKAKQVGARSFSYECKQMKYSTHTVLHISVQLYA